MIRFYNGKVLRFGDGMTISADEVWTDGSRICYVGVMPDVLPEFEREIDLRGDLLMPGFKNAHTHTAMTFLRSYADDVSFNEWFYNQVLPQEAKLSPEMTYLFTKLGIMEYLTSGITSNFDMYFNNDAYARAVVDTGYRTVICSSMNNFDADITNIEREYIKYNNMGERVSYRLGIHAEYTTCMERMEYMVGLAEKYEEPCFMHLSETEGEVQGCLERYGVTPPQLMEKIGMFRYGGGGFHCVWMSDEDIELFARKKLWAVTNPCSNLKLASGIAPVDRLVKAGVPMAIGTDGAASNNALDMFREMYLASALQKVVMKDAAAGGADEVLKMACVGGAGVMGLRDCDDIAAGKLADMIVIDLQRPNMQPLNNIARNIVYSGSKENVRLTMVNGRVLYENGEFFIGDDAADIYRAANDFMEKVRQ